MSEQELDIDALVTGRSLPALLAALNLAEVGLRVVVVGGDVELPDAGERDPEGVISKFLQRIADPIQEGSEDPRARPLRVEAKDPWLLTRAGNWSPQATHSVLGIPAVPLAREVIDILGSSGALRAYLDRVLPLLTIGKTRSFGVLVRKRLGRAALGGLVEPLVRERFGVSPENVDAPLAAPGLNEALSRAGSLSAAALAYSERNDQQESLVSPAAGWQLFFEALRARLNNYGVEFIDEPVVAVVEHEGAPDGENERADEQGGDRGWVVTIAGREEPVLARSLVLDLPRCLDNWSDIAPRDTLGAIDSRIYAEIDISSEGLPAELMSSGCAAVRSLGEWSLRIEASGTAASARVTISGPRAQGAGALGDPTQLNALLAEAGLRAEAESAWKIERRTTPSATIDERDRRTGALSVLDAEFPTRLTVGRSVHGDDLAVSLDTAHWGAVALRRSLLGLTEDGTDEART